jgi:CRP-like cAMP-binding protein
MDNAFINFLRTHAPVSAEDAASLLEAFEEREFPEGGELFRGGHVCRQLFFIIEGVLRIVVQNEKGVDVTHYFLKENQFCTILKSFTEEGVASESIQAACAVRVRVIHKRRLLELYTRLPYLRGVIDGVIQKGLIEKINTRNAYLGLDSAARYQLFVSRQPEIATRVSLTDVASYLEVTPQSLSRIRRKK